jgi:hypothetical protein
MMMSPEMNSGTPDLVRWSFSVDPTHREAIEGHLADLGADVLVREGHDFLVTWDEPEHEDSEVIEALWALNGAPFEVISETFHRLELHTIHHVDEEPGAAAA